MKEGLRYQVKQLADKQLAMQEALNDLPLAEIYEGVEFVPEADDEELA